MTDTPIDPAATPDDDDRPEIAADDAGASALAGAVVLLIAGVLLSFRLRPGVER